MLFNTCSHLLVALKLQSTTITIDSLSFLTRYILIKFHLLTLPRYLFSNLSMNFIALSGALTVYLKKTAYCQGSCLATHREARVRNALQKGGVPATPSGTATLLRLSPSHQFRPRSLLAVTNFRHPRLPWLDGRCVQGPGTYSPRHG